VVELRNEGAQFFQIGYADCLQIGFARIGRTIDVFGRRLDLGNLAVKTDGPRLGGNLPFGGSEEDAHMVGAERGDTRRNAGGLDGMIDGAEQDGVARNDNDHAATGEVCDDFVFLGQGKRRVQPQQTREQASGGDGAKHVHEISILRLDVMAMWFSICVKSGKIKAFEQVRMVIMGLRKLNSLKHNGKKVAEILAAHERFWAGKEGGARADLSGADLSGADLSKLNLAGANLQNANLEGSDLRGSRLPVANLSGARLKKADLRNTDMTEANLPGADLKEAQASGVEFFRCDLSNTNFRGALLRNANFRDANVDGAVFTGADMGIAILRETNVSKADLSGVDLSTTLMPPGYAAKKQSA